MLPSGTCESSLCEFSAMSNFDFVVCLLRTLRGSSRNLRLAGLIGASDGVIDFGNPEIEIDEASTDCETRTTEWNENVMWTDAPFAFVENELEGAWSRDGNPSEEAVTLRCCFSIVKLSSSGLGFLLSSDQGIFFSLIVREVPFSFLFSKIKWSILIETTQVSIARSYEGSETFWEHHEI